jgi:hypothetical protein
MPPWLYVWIFRFARGERLEKPKPADYRLAFGFLFLMPVLLAAFEKTPKRWFDGSLWIVWLVCTATGLISWTMWIMWARYVPAVISLALSVVAWTVLFLNSPFK